MFINQTVFILGAGASWHYGYPTGEDLVKKVIEKARTAGEYFRTAINLCNEHRPQYLERDVPDNAKLSTQDIKAQWRKACGECEALVSRLRQVNPLVIDYFLGQNPTLQPIGKLMIAWVILECEMRYSKEGGNINRQELLLNSPNLEDRHQRAKTVDVSKYKDNWYRFILHKSTTDCTKSKDLLKNQVHFVTFNYDVSLEHALRKGLGSIELFKAEDIDRFFSENRIIHVYGKVREASSIVSLDWNISWTGHDFANVANHGAYKSFLDAVYAASKGLWVIDPTDNESDKASIKAAKKAIKDAACVYILGYGFDPNNSKRLGLSEALHYEKNTKCVLFTNYNNSNRINKSASRVLFGNSKHLLSSSPEGDPTGGYYFEKSIRDTYEALELDFDPFEEQLSSSTKI